MALIKPVKTPHGVLAKYHKLLRAEIDAVAATMTLTVAIYADSEARDTGGLVLWHEYLTVPFEDLTQDPRAALYALLAEHGRSHTKDAASDTKAAPLEVIRLVPGAKLPPPPPEPPAPPPPEPPAPPLPPPPGPLAADEDGKRA